MNKTQLIVAWVIVLLPFSTIIDGVEARNGCCSHHGGVCGSQCCDGTALSEKCAPYYPASSPKDQSSDTERKEEIVHEEEEREGIEPIESWKEDYTESSDSDTEYSGSGWIFDLGAKKSYLESKRSNGETYYKVAKVINGTKLKLDYDLFATLIGIITPDFKRDKFKLASLNKSKIRIIKKEGLSLLKNLVEGKFVRIDIDEKKNDKKGNTVLGYIYLEDGTFVNAELIKQGLALADSQPPNTKNDGIFLKLEQEAKGNKRGLWSYK